MKTDVGFRSYEPLKLAYVDRTVLPGKMGFWVRNQIDANFVHLAQCVCFWWNTAVKACRTCSTWADHSEGWSKEASKRRARKRWSWLFHGYIVVTSAANNPYHFTQRAWHVLIRVVCSLLDDPTRTMYEIASKNGYKTTTFLLFAMIRYGRMKLFYTVNTCSLTNFSILICRISVVTKDQRCIFC